MNGMILASQFINQNTHVKILGAIGAPLLLISLGIAYWYLHRKGK